MLKWLTLIEKLEGVPFWVYVIGTVPNAWASNQGPPFDLSDIPRKSMFYQLDRKECHPAHKASIVHLSPCQS